MTTARQYNEAVEGLAEVQARNRELETRNTGQLMRIDELMQAVEDVNRAGVLKIRELEARIALLEAVREAAEPLNRWLHDDGKVMEMGRSPDRGYRAAMIEEFTDLTAALQIALAAAEKDASEPPQDAQDGAHVTQPGKWYGNTPETLRSEEWPQH